MWFDFTIKTIDNFKAFFPLGGTSNHFKVDKLLEIGKWDGYNVTEDAELGVRILKSKYKVAYLNSITLEECPIKIYAWLKQRTRWLKGFMQTFCEHLFFKKPITVKSNVDFLPIRKTGILNIIIFNVFIIMSFLFFISAIFIFTNLNIFNKIEELNNKTFINFCHFLGIFNFLFLFFLLFLIYIFAVSALKYRDFTQL